MRRFLELSVLLVAGAALGGCIQSDPTDNPGPPTSPSISANPQIAKPVMVPGAPQTFSSGADSGGSSQDSSAGAVDGTVGATSQTGQPQANGQSQ